MVAANGNGWPGRRWSEFVLAGCLLTRLPLPRMKLGVGIRTSDGVWAYPIFGAVVGLIASAAYWLTWSAGLPATLCAIAALAASALITGALHEDGWADFWDGIGGGATPADKLRIMSDSRVGSYGALALVLATAAKWSALAALAGPQAAALLLVACHTIGRGVLVIMFALLGPAKTEGLGAAAGRPSGLHLAAGAVITALVCLGVAPSLRALALLIAGGVAALMISWVCRRQLGGHTGDAFGAAEQLGEIAVLWTGLALAGS